MAGNFPNAKGHNQVVGLQHIHKKDIANNQGNIISIKDNTIGGSMHQYVNATVQMDEIARLRNENQKLRDVIKKRDDEIEELRGKYMKL